MRNLGKPSMRVIDAKGMRLVHLGKKWDHDTDPCSKDMIGHLERNEAIVSWLQPINSNTVKDQIPCIIVGDRYCAMSLRMMKAIFRSVRLKKGFKNVEPLSQGGYKLKIPQLLLAEKMRTQARFNVGFTRLLTCITCVYIKHIFKYCIYNYNYDGKS